MRLTKAAILLFVFGCISTTAFSQLHDPVKWKTGVKHVQGNEYDLYFTAAIESGWYVYSQFLPSDDGPVATVFEFKKTSGVTFIGKVKESGNKKSGFDPVFQMNLTKYAKKAIFRQRIKVKDPSRVYKITGGYEFMTCNNERCLAPTYNEFAIKTKKIKKKAAPNVIANNPTPKIEIPKPSVGTVENVKSDDVTWAPNSVPVKWKVEGVRVSKTEYDITFSANIKDNWEMYSRYTGSKGPMPLTIEYDNRDERLGISKRITAKSANKVRNVDDRYGAKLTRYKEKVSFKQRVKIEKGSRSVKGNLYYVAANGGENSSLSPQRVNFALTLPSKITPTPAMIAKMKRDAAKRMAGNQAEEGSNDEGEGDESDEAIADNDEDPEDATGQADADPLDAVTGTKFKYTYAKEDCSGEAAVDIKETSNLLVFLLGLGGGLLALLTPCIYPMIPITVSFFTKRSKTRAQGIANALAYGLSIIGIYVSLGLIVTGAFGPEALNTMATNIYFNLIFFAAFLLFAFSFFGFYELTLPSSWSTWTDSAADKKGGMLGIFFMAFTLSLVSFSCTGPIIGSLLVETASGSTETMFGGLIKVKPLLGMLGFSTALALPFALFALFPSWLNSLPKSGGWMNHVKVTLGFLELALALKFLSTVDLVYNLQFLKIELFLGLWIAIFAALAAYMFGLIKFPLNYPGEKITTGRKITGLASLAFVAYLGYGLFTYQPLNLLSGLAPPVTHNFFRQEAAMDFPDCPQGIRCFKDYDEGLAYAKDRNLPVMIDFTGHGCVNCRKMEENVWGLENIKPLLEQEYVLISLYVDDRKKVKGADADKYRNVGAKWSQFQIEHFNSNSQPLYVLMSPNEEILNSPKGYTPDVKQYEEFLQCGIDRWNSIKK